MALHVMVHGLGFGLVPTGHEKSLHVVVSREKRDGHYHERLLQSFQSTRDKRCRKAALLLQHSPALHGSVVHTIVAAVGLGTIPTGHVKFEHKPSSKQHSGLYPSLPVSFEVYAKLERKGTEN